jgi:hypothetical protein
MLLGGEEDSERLVATVPSAVRAGDLDRVPDTPLHRER